MRAFLNALLLVETLINETESEDPSAIRSALVFRHLENVVLSNAEEYYVLLHFETAATHARGQKQNRAFNGLAPYSYASSPLQKLRSRHSSACEKRSFSFQVSCSSRLRIQKLSLCRPK